ncbi:MAG TPA: Uma2 family endonuclease [Isosphaeraceae bacterium]|nr:Uma2 family endonuclease [Isosphaeraceae bacterium]
MSTIDEPRTTLPPLSAGQRLDQPTFHDRYEAMPPETRAELVGGIVYMPSPMRSDHGFESRRVSGWLLHYELHTPGVWGADGLTVKLPPWFEPQPDCLLRIPAELGGQSWIDADGYLTGAPELVIEVARSSKAFDLGAKKVDYERAGVREYVVVAIKPDQVHWFIRRDDRFEPLLPGPDGVFRSEVFPGLWLDPQAFYAGNLKRLIEGLELGLASAEHTTFRARLAGQTS